MLKCNYHLIIAKEINKNPKLSYINKDSLDTMDISNDTQKSIKKKPRNGGVLENSVQGGLSSNHSSMRTKQ